MIKSSATNERIAWRRLVKYERKHGSHNAGLKDFLMLLKRNLQKNRQKARCRLVWRLYEQGGHDGR